MTPLFSKLSPRLRDGLFFIYQKLNSTLLGPAIIATLVFGLFFDFSIIEPANTAWLLSDGGDISQGYLGSTAFRLDTWHFPITKTVLLNNSEGVCIVYTDSNPLLSIVTKLIPFIFLPEYQFFGIWYLSCWILQGVFGYLLIKTLTRNDLFALVAVALFCLLPTQYARWGHANLVAFWTILWALYIFIHPDWSSNKKQRLFFIVLALTSMIHAYFLFMTLFIAGTWYSLELIHYIKTSNYRMLARFLGVNALFGAGLALLLFVLGYFYNLAPVIGSDGFGFYSMNLNAPFNANYPTFSNFLDGLPSYGGQYEGYQYMGLGFLLLLLFISLTTLQKHKPYLLSMGMFYLCLCLLFLLIKEGDISLYEKIVVCSFFVMYGLLSYALLVEREKKLLYLYIPASLCFLYALSFRIMIGETVIMEFMPNDDAWYMFFVRSGRSSGRFFWVTTLFLLIAALFLLHRYCGNRKSIWILSVIILIQYADLSIDGFLIASNKRDYESPLDSFSKKQILASHSIKFLTDFNMKIAEFSLLNSKALNKFVLARASGELTKTRLEKERTDFDHGRLDITSLYLFDSPMNLPLNRMFNVRNFYGGKLSVAPSSYHSKEDAFLKVKHRHSDSLSTLIQQIQSSPLVLIAAKDEASVSMPDFFKQQLDASYKSKIVNLGYRCSYIAVFSYGKLIEEKLDFQHAVEHQFSLLNNNIFIKSAGFDAGNEAVIKINGIDLSKNETGLNVLILEDDIWNSYSYNTFEH